MQNLKKEKKDPTAFQPEVSYTFTVDILCIASFYQQ
jgi:hypothetical protein